MSEARVYRGTSLDVTWDKDTCIHAGACVGNLPAVFEVGRRPWVLPDQAEAAEVRRVVALCPVAALKIREHAPDEPE